MKILYTYINKNLWDMHITRGFFKTAATVWIENIGGDLYERTLTFKHVLL